jgi:hypothetical protein
MTDTVRAQLNCLTAAVQEAVDGRDWETAAALESDVRATLEALVVQLKAGAAHDPDILRAELEAAAARIARLRGELAHHERAMVREASMVSAGRRAAAAYERTAGTSS